MKCYKRPSCLSSVGLGALLISSWALGAATYSVENSCERVFLGQPKLEEAPTIGLTAEKLAFEIAARRMRVAEFAFIRKEAESRGLRVWLFGGTAAGYSHYVKWDLLRKTQFQSDRFDYDYTHIYRSTQDLDIVVDGTAEQAALFEHVLKAKFPYFLGSKAAAWEVRSLREPREDKGGLLDDFNFMNQHTDSHSTGMVELTDPPPGESVIRDLRDWTSQGNSRYFQDVLESKIKYYYSPRHAQTDRALAGKNPAIFSVIRYLTKAFQYELKMRDEDLAQIQKVIEEFDPGSDLSLPTSALWIEKNGKKLIQHAVNIEYAWNQLEKLGIRKKLIAIHNNEDERNSLAWWLNKEPLRSISLDHAGDHTGDHAGEGRTAQELGLTKVSHETNDFLAYESITRAHTGSPNVLISRQNHVGETALYGDGFYTLSGNKGGRGTGITIRFEVDPRAREGRDFIIAEDSAGRCFGKLEQRDGCIIIFKNKNALRVIPESLQMTPSQYFQFLAEGKKISQEDQALLWKLKRRISQAHASGALGSDELHQVRLIVLDQMKSQAPNHLLVFREWMSLEATRLGREPDLLVNLSKGGYRVRPDLWVSELSLLVRGTELESWVRDEYLFKLLHELKKDLGDRVIKNCLFSSDPLLQNLGYEALKDAQQRRPSAFLSALEQLSLLRDQGGVTDVVTDAIIRKWLNTVQESSNIEEKAAFIAQESHSSNWLSNLPSVEFDAVSQVLKQKTMVPLFEKLVEDKGARVRNSILDHALPESFQFVQIEIPKKGKTFEMGVHDPELKKYFYEPIRQVTLTESFEIQVTPLTEYQRALLLGEDVLKLRDQGNRPAVFLSWKDAKDLAAKLSEMDPGYVYRLPYESEWEYVARAGTRTSYSFGDDVEQLADYAVHSGKYGGKPSFVATRKPNPIGLYDMHGNIWEWCEDYYEDGVDRVIRGGSWYNIPDQLRSARRGHEQPRVRILNIGVRFVRVRAGASLPWM